MNGLKHKLIFSVNKIAVLALLFIKRIENRKAKVLPSLFFTYLYN